MMTVPKLLAAAGLSLLVAAGPSSHPAPAQAQMARAPTKPRGPAALTNASRFSQDEMRGVVIPTKQVGLIAPVEGMLDSIEVEEGDRVQVEQVLARMDDKIQKVVVEAATLQAQSVAEIERSKLAMEEATMNLEQIQDLFTKGAATRYEVQGRRLAVGQAEATHTAALEAKLLAEANLKLETQRLEQLQIRAPFGGIIIRVLVEPGATLSGSDQILYLADLDTLEAQLNLPVGMFGQLERGKTYRLRAESPVNDELEGRLKTIDPIIDTASRTFRCVFEIDNPDAALPAGFTVYLVEEMEGE